MSDYRLDRQISPTAKGQTTVRKTTNPGQRVTSGKGPETAVHGLVILRLTECQERAAYVPCLWAGGMS